MSFTQANRLANMGTVSSEVGAYGELFGEKALNFSIFGKALGKT